MLVSPNSIPHYYPWGKDIQKVYEETDNSLVKRYIELARGCCIDPDQVSYTSEPMELMWDVELGGLRFKHFALDGKTCDMICPKDPGQEPIEVVFDWDDAIHMVIAARDAKEKEYYRLTLLIEDIETICKCRPELNQYTKAFVNRCSELDLTLTKIRNELTTVKTILTNWSYMEFEPEDVTRYEYKLYNVLGKNLYKVTAELNDGTTSSFYAIARKAN
jgi:hypothetical protein